MYCTSKIQKITYEKCNYGDQHTYLCRRRFLQNRSAAFMQPSSEAVLFLRGKGFVRGRNILVTAGQIHNL